MMVKNSQPLFQPDVLSTRQLVANIAPLGCVFIIPTVEDKLNNE